MTQLSANIDADDQVLTVDTLPPSPYVQAGDELIEIRASFPERIYQPTQAVLPPKIRVQRGVAGTTAASHNSGTTLTPVYGAGVSGGGGGVTVDNQDDPPAEVTTLIVPGATLSDGEADLSSIQTVYSRTTTLTDAQIKALPTTQIELVPAIADSVLVLMRAFYILDSSAGAYTNFDVAPNPQLNITCGVAGGAQIDGSNYLQLRGWLNQTHDAASFATPMTYWEGDVIYEQIISNNLASITNKPFLLRAYNGEAGDFTGGNAANTLKVVVWFSVLDVA